MPTNDALDWRQNAVSLFLIILSGALLIILGTQIQLAEARSIGDIVFLVAVGLSIIVLSGMAVTSRWEKWAVVGAMLTIISAIFAFSAETLQ
ncbi:hypothetical protein [Halomicrococcus sp. NG-SE-24]|uniref:hypothetical protein n=1 Tax=Halomicrococcus sp. NG-SE-24 TaxID=3436928 RepID=UPI003D9684FA